MDDILQKIVDGEYEIQPTIAIAADGGTISFQVKNDNGETENLFLDRRINTETKDVFFYGSEYPGKEGPALIGKNDALVAKIESQMRRRISNISD
jgi:hypothetical protein